MLSQINRMYIIYIYIECWREIDFEPHMDRPRSASKTLDTRPWQFSGGSPVNLGFISLSLHV